MAADPHFDKVALLLRMDGAAGSKVFVDASPTPKTQTVSASGAALSTARSKFGGASGLFDGGYIWFGAANDAALLPGAQDFCIEAWCYDVGGGNRRVLFGNAPSSGSGSTLACLLRVDGTFSVTVVVGGTSHNISPATATPLNTWYHLALTRSGTTLRLFLNGVQIGSVTGVSGSVAGGGGQFALGSLGNYLAYGGAYGVQWMGNVDDFRYTIGAARYTSDFTPPGESHPGAGALSGVVRDASDAPAARLVRALREDSGAFVGETMSNATTGAYSFQAAYSGPHTLIAYPGAGEALPALALRGVMPA